MKRSLPPSLGWALAVLVVVLLIVALVAGRDQVFEGLQLLEQLVKANLAVSLLVYVAIFAVGTSLTLPIGSLMCLAAGYLFGFLLGSTVALGGGVAGATMTFVLTRHTAGPEWRRRVLETRAAPLLKILERDAFYYLVLLRTVPVAPFFLINAAAALTAVSGRLFLVATVLGLIPTSVIFAGVGSGLGSLIDARDLAGPQLLLEPAVALPLAALAVLIASAWAIRRRMA